MTRVTTLRNVVGSMDLGEGTLTSRDSINSQLRGVLDDATGRWGLRVNRVKIKAIDPPKTIKDAMEKQMRAERDKRASILGAEGQRQSQILTAEGDKQGAILRAEGDRTAAILKRPCPSLRPPARQIPPMSRRCGPRKRPLRRSPTLQRPTTSGKSPPGTAASNQPFTDPQKQ